MTDKGQQRKRVRKEKANRKGRYLLLLYLHEARECFSLTQKAGELYIFRKILINRLCKLRLTGKTSVV